MQLEELFLKSVAYLCMLHAKSKKKKNRGLGVHFGFNSQFRHPLVTIYKSLFSLYFRYFFLLRLSATLLWRTKFNTAWKLQIFAFIFSSSVESKKVRLRREMFAKARVSEKARLLYSGNNASFLYHTIKICTL